MLAHFAKRGIPRFHPSGILLIHPANLNASLNEKRYAREPEAAPDLSQIS